MIITRNRFQSVCSAINDLFLAITHSRFEIKIGNHTFIFRIISNDSDIPVNLV